MTVLTRPSSTPSPLAMPRRMSPPPAPPALRRTPRPPVNLPRSLSQTRVAAAARCARAYAFKYIDHRPEARVKTPDSSKGVLTHKVLELLFALPPQERTIEAAAALLDAAWDDVCATEPECADALTDDYDQQTLFSEVLDLMRVYLTVEDPTVLLNTQQEVRFAVTNAGVPLEGVIDRVDVQPVTLAERINEYKIGKPPPEHAANDRLFQVKIYALARYAETGAIPAATRLIYLGGGPGLDPASRIVEWIPTEDGLRVVAQRLGWAWNQIADLHKGRDRRPRPMSSCGGCQFLALCPEGQQAVQEHADTTAARESTAPLAA